MYVRNGLQLSPASTIFVGVLYMDVDEAKRWSDIEALLQGWQKRARESQFSHYEAAKYFGALNYGLGIPVVVLTSSVGTTVFATLQKQVDMRTQIAVGGVSVLAAILASLQTFLRFGDRAGKHRSIGAQYGAVRRRIESLLVLPPSDRGEPKQILEDLRGSLDSLAEASPDIPQRIWKRVTREFQKTAA